MRRPCIFVAATALATAIFVACGDSTFTTDNPDASTDDAGVQSDAAIPPDAGVADSGLPPDASAGDAATHFCATGGPHDLCDDFDRLDGGWPTPPWDNATLSGAPSFDTTTPVSPPAALIVNDPGGSEPTPSFNKTVLKLSSQVTCDLDIRIDSFGSSATLDYLFVVTQSDGSNTSEFEAELYVEPGAQPSWGLVALQSPDGGAFTSDNIPLGAATPNQWVHASIAVAAPNKLTVKVTQGGITLGSLDSTNYVVPANTTQTSVTLGSSLADPNWIIEFDNVVCDAN